MGSEMKVTFHVTYGVGGFQFAHYMNTTDYTLALNKANDVGRAYMKCCGNNVDMPLVVASRVDIPGDSQILTELFNTIVPGVPNLGKGQVVIPAVSDNADMWWTAALLRLGSSAVKRSFQYMRGIPDSVVVGNKFPLDNQAWRRAVQDYFDVLIAGQWGMFGIPKTPTVRQPITGIVQDNGTFIITITTAGVHNVPLGGKFHISYFGPQAAKLSPNGTWVADVVTGTTIQVKPYQGMTIPGDYKVLGKLWSLEKTFASYDRTQMVIEKVATRQAGRPTGVLKGRNKRR